MQAEEEDELVNHLIKTMFLNHPLALPGSATKIYEDKIYLHQTHEVVNQQMNSSLSQSVYFKYLSPLCMYYPLKGVLNVC